MNRINKEIDEYFAEIKRNLICSPSQKNTIINDLRESVVNYVEENNIDDIKKVYAQFGTPQDIADQSISSLPVCLLQLICYLKDELFCLFPAEARVGDGPAVNVAVRFLCSVLNVAFYH